MIAHIGNAFDPTGADVSHSSAREINRLPMNTARITPQSAEDCGGVEAARHCADKMIPSETATTEEEEEEETADKTGDHADR